MFKEAIRFLNSLPPLKPLQWDENLVKSAQSHVNDIGPKGLLLYQSSDGTEPEDRISKFGNYSESLGENIDFGPNDAMGVLVSLTLDDGEEERPHRENLFKDDYQKVGIACGPHSTEFQMCVMDFAFDFQPLEGNNNMNNYNSGNNENYDNRNNDNYGNNNNNNRNNDNYGNNNDNNRNNDNYVNNNNNDRNNDNYGNINNNVNQSPIVKLSLQDDELKQKEMKNINQNVNNVGNNDIEKLTLDTTNLIRNLRVVSKKVEIITKVTYTYEDGSSKVVTQNQCHEFKQ